MRRLMGGGRDGVGGGAGGRRVEGVGRMTGET